ncbi:holin family protein [Tropicibacter sp. Alg240-R139]|uniref:holin family protein n=1 Tax=Tropicibacter sp. Alg240-R139 TaxID=2305991 RepID=UPI0013DEA205|nr:holin family protein [Tropicibacter sp. Alg240-R139]
MGLISGVVEFLFGGGRNVVRETAEVFRENAEAGAQRAQSVQTQSMTQFGAEFAVPRRGMFDRFMDGLNRLPRPALALGTLGLFVSAMVDPLWFSARMQGIALVPEPLWWLLGVIVSFYFGARHQTKVQDLQRDLADTMARAPQVMANIVALDQMRSDGPGVANPTNAPHTIAKAVTPSDNPALEDWKALQRKSD